MTKEIIYSNVRTFLACGFFLLLVSFSANSAQSATLTVTSNGDQTINTAGCNDGCTLREAITEATAGDTINFDANLAGKTIILSGTELTVNKSLTIINNNSPLVAVSGNQKSRVFNITAANVELDGLIIMNGKVVTTTLDADGGGIIATSPITIKNSLITGNSVTSSGNNAEGGAIRASGGSGTITNSTISGNFAVSSVRRAQGGGIYGDFTITNSTVSGNSAISNGTNRNAEGGGLWGDFTITNSAVISNYATSTNGNCRGGGFYGSFAISTITNSTISGNSAIANSTSQGGGIYGSFFTLTDSTVSDNSATSTSSTADGGGVLGFNFTITNSTITSNSAITTNNFSQGGGVRGAGSITNSTITGNAVINSGGAILGGGFYLSDSSSLQNTIIAQNIGGDIFRGGGTLTTIGNNLVGNNQNVTIEFPVGTPNINNDYVGTSVSPIDAMLDSLANNFGDTATHALLSGSLAINNGNNTGAPTTDQRGFPRIQGGTIDIGAYEFSGGVTIARLTLPNGLTGINYNEHTGAAGGTLPYTFSFTGTPPPGLVINSTTGKITGMPTSAGTFNFGVQVQDSTALAERNISKKTKSNLAPNVAVQNYQIQVFAPTAAAVQLRGRVYASNGRSLNRALVVLTDSFGGSKIYHTNSFGYFNFNELRAGEVYILDTYRRGYEFEPRLVTLKDSITNFEIRSLP